MSNNQLYWLFQISGWFLYWLVVTFFNFIDKTSTMNEKLNEQIGAALYVAVGIVITHIFRTVVVKQNWLSLSGGTLIKRLLLSLLIITVSIPLVYVSIGYLLGFSYLNGLRNLGDIINNMLSVAIVAMSWMMLYFGIQYFRNYKNAQVLQLKQESAEREMTLNKLKSQLNPHFIFNSLNSIRALVKADPEKARSAITYLANIFRKTLQMDKVSLTSFDEEIQIVRDYLTLEKIRYEERLNVSFSLDPLSSSFQVPPMMIQTLVENGIKHGILTLAKGGTIELKTQVESETLNLEITNPGKYQHSENHKGYGLDNTKERLNLLFDGKATFHIENVNGLVTTHIQIPKVNGHDKNHNS